MSTVAWASVCSSSVSSRAASVTSCSSQGSSSSVNRWTYARLHRAEPLGPGAGEAEPPGAGVVGVVPALDEAGGLQRDDGPGHHGRGDAQAGGEVAGTGIALAQRLQQAQRGAGGAEGLGLAVGHRPRRAHQLAERGQQLRSGLFAGGHLIISFGCAKQP